MTYLERWTQGTEGMEALSTGLCPGCTTCAAEYGFDPDDASSMADFEEAWSTGQINTEPQFTWSGCDLCNSRLGSDMEPYHWIEHIPMTWTEAVMHWIRETWTRRRPQPWTRTRREIQHGNNACMDCVIFMANGDLPEEEETPAWTS